MKFELSRLSDTGGRGDSERLRDTKRESAEKPSAEAEKRPYPAAEYCRTVDDALEGKHYQHWESDAARENNRRQIDNYDRKKRAVDLASLETQSAVLKEHGSRFTEENLRRIESEFGSNKTEIYNERTFSAEKARDYGTYRVLGLRDVPDGKICIRDNDDLDALRHVATHETMHDLSYQAQDSRAKTEIDARGRLVTETETTMISGLHRIERTDRMADGVSDAPEYRQFNRYLNEGYTELYTIEQMQQRGEFPDCDSYTDEVGWALALREKVGADAVADAYFGGDLESLEERVNNMSSVPDAWKELNRNIDAYHYSRDLRCREAADAILDSLQGPRTYEKRLVRR